MPPVPLGLYDRPDDTPGVESVEIPSGDVSRFLRDATRFLERLDDALPGGPQDWFKVLERL